MIREMSPRRWSVATWVTVLIAYVFVLAGCAVIKPTHTTEAPDTAPSMALCLATEALVIQLVEPTWHPGSWSQNLCDGYLDELGAEDFIALWSDQEAVARYMATGSWKD